MAATETHAAASASARFRAALTMREVGRRDGDRLPSVAPPERPGVATGDEEEVVRHTQALQLGREALVLALQRVLRARVEPDERAFLPQLGGDQREGERWAVVAEPGLVPAEDRPHVVGLLVARPALEHPELAWVVEPDVERRVAALGEAPDRPARTRRDRAIALVDRVDDVTREERLPARVSAGPVRPLLVGERAGRAERHHDDHRRDLLLREERVLDDADPDRTDEPVRVAREAVQQVEHRVALSAVCVAGRQVDDNALAAPAHRAAHDADRLEGPELAHERRVVRRRESAVQPERVDVSIDAEEADGEERHQRHRRCHHQQGFTRLHCLRVCRCTPCALSAGCVAVMRRLTPAESGLGGRFERAGWKAFARLGVVVRARRHVVRRGRVEERGEVLDLPPAGPELEHAAAVERDALLLAVVVEVEQLAEEAEAGRLAVERPRRPGEPLDVGDRVDRRSEEHTSELQSQSNLVCRLLLEKKNNILVPLHEVITFLVSMQISISSLQTHNVNRCGRSRHLARKLSLRRKRSSPNVFEMAATETITSIILIKLIRVSLGTVSHPRRFKIVVIDIQIPLKQMLRDFIGIRVNRAKKSGMVNITSSVNSRERSGINTILHELNPLFTINVTMRDIKSKNVYSRVNSKATTQWRKTESANGVHLEGVASDNRSS